MSVVVAITLAGILVPVLAVPIPPLVDYPNHFARLCLITSGGDHPALRDIYVIDWSRAGTNLGIDLVAALLGPVFGCEAVARTLLAASFLLPPLGAVLLFSAIHRGVHVWQAGFAGFAWTATALAGFMNFQISVGLALVFAAADVALARRIPGAGLLALRIAVGCALMTTHFFGALFYAALLFALSLGWAPVRISAPRDLLRRGLKATVPAMAAFAVPLLILMTSAALLPGAEVNRDRSFDWTGYGLVRKFNTVTTVFRTYDFGVDLLWFGIAVLIGWIVAFRMQPAAHGGLVFVGCGLLLLALIAPWHLRGVAAIDWRLPIMATFCLLAAIRPSFHSARVAAVVGSALMALSLSRAAWVGSVWLARGADVAAVQRAIADVPAGSALLPVMHVARREDELPGRRMFWPTFANFPTLAVSERGAFVATFFTMVGIQPIRVQQAWEDMDVPYGSPIPIHLLHHAGPSPDPAALAHGPFEARRMLADWRRRYQYVLLVNADMNHRFTPGSMPPGLTRVNDHGFARLYRIDRATTAPYAPSPPARR